jgi:endoglucanase
VRVPIRFAVACEPAARRVAARLDPALRGGGAALLPRERDGAPAPGAVRHAVALIGAAGAARAAGDRRGARALLARAQALDRAHPSYYGAAWVALGRVLLSTGMLGRC